MFSAVNAPASAPVNCLDHFTRAGVNVSPILWQNEEQEMRKVAAQQKAAAAMARYLGGQEIACTRDLGPCLDKALSSLAQGWVVQVAGPAVDWSSRYTLNHVELYYQPDRALLDVKRPFLHRAEMPVDYRAP